ncbi:MAG: cyclic nucleotide-binding domain-containing protein [Alphaproteobacteria bacterium]|nr:cyclic nucleotide-binding domain-containing protein [Alphaproteobacteria bacterium]
MSTEEVRAALAAHPFCQGLPEAALDTLAGHARLQVLAEGLTLFEAGERSHASWLIREGRVGIALHELEVVETVEAGELLGWSWLIGQWQWHADARALTEVHAIRLDGDALAERCRAEPSLGFELARRALRAATGRLERSRLQAHDVFRVRGA